jgi:hypothetical protein
MAFLPGDHIYISRGVPSIHATVEHHAIVVATLDAHQVEIVEHGVYNPKDGTKKWVAGTGLDHGLLHEVGEVKRRTIDLRLEPGWTVATELSDAYPAPAVVARALFVLEHADLLPPYHVTNCNGECVARWCKTGQFESSQARGLYETTVSAITEKVAPALDASGKTVSKAIAPPAAKVVVVDGGVAAPAAGETPTATSPNATAAAATSHAHTNHHQSNLGDMARTTQEKASTAIHTASEKASTAIHKATDKVVAAVKAVGVMVDKRQKAVQDRWSQTNETLDLAFAQHMSQSAAGNNNSTATK